MNEVGLYKMIKNKYDNFYFWDQLFTKYKGDVELMFKNMPITIDSVFFHGVIVDCNNTNPRDTWISFPDIKSMIGFIKYVYIPTVYFMFLGDEDEITCPDIDCKSLLEHMNSYEQCKNKKMIPEMGILLERLDNIFNMRNESIFIELKLFTRSFEELCNKRIEKFAYFNVFRNPSEVGEHIINSYKDDESVDLQDIENQLGVGAEEWINICKNVYNNRFMSRKFIDILNNRIIDML